MTRVPEEDEGLVEWIHRALPRKTQLKLNDKLRMQAVNPETDMHMSKVTFEWLRETCHVVELELKKPDFELKMPLRLLSLFQQHLNL